MDKRRRTPYGEKQRPPKTPLWGFEPKCAASVLHKYTMYNYSDHPVVYLTHSDSPGRAGHRRPASIVSSSSSFFRPSRMVLELVYRTNGGSACPRPGAPRPGSGRSRLSRLAVLVPRVGAESRPVPEVVPESVPKRCGACLSVCVCVCVCVGVGVGVSPPGCMPQRGHGNRTVPFSGG